MRKVELTVWATIEPERIMGTLLTVFLRKTIMRSLFSWYVREDTIALRVPTDPQKKAGLWARSIIYRAATV